MSVMAAFHSLDFILDLAMRVLKGVIDMGPDKNDKTTVDMPDLLKDIYNSKMTRCEDQLSDHEISSSGVNSNDSPDNGRPSDSTASQMSPVPFTDNDETDPLRLTSDHIISAHDAYTTSTTGSRDLESLQMVATHPNNSHQGRRMTSPEIFEGAPLEGEESILDQRYLNISFKKTCHGWDLKSEMATNHHEGDEMVTNHREGDEMPQLASDIVLGLRNIGDNLDRKINPKMKKNMWQSCMTYAISDLRNSFPVESFKMASNLSVQVMAEYNRL